MLRPSYIFHRPLKALAASCLLGALATDIAYWRTTDFLWADFSDWLITAAVVVGAVAFLVALVEALLRRRRGPFPWILGLLNVIAWLLAVADMFFHTRDSWTSVAPWGLALSFLAVLFVFIAEWMQHATSASRLAEEPV